jgi:hypothetical protein
VCVCVCDNQINSNNNWPLTDSAYTQVLRLYQAGAAPRAQRQAAGEGTAL